MASRNNQQLNLMDILSQFGLLGMTDENETKLQGTFSSRPTSLRNQNQINIDIINIVIISLLHLNNNFKIYLYLV